MPATPDAHTKAAARDGRQYACRYLSAWAVIGKGTNQLSPYDVKMAMVWHVGNTHYRHREIQGRHFNEVAANSGIGKDAEHILNEILIATPQVIESIKADLPEKFPPAVFTPIIEGLTRSAELLARQTKAA